MHACGADLLTEYVLLDLFDYTVCIYKYIYAGILNPVSSIKINPVDRCMIMEDKSRLSSDFSSMNYDSW